MTKRSSAAAGYDVVRWSDMSAREDTQGGGTTVPFVHVRPKKTFLYVAEQLLEAIRRGDYPPGSVLPPERKLAEEFGISRQVMRETLAALHLAQVVETRAGIGTYVTNTPTDDLTRGLWTVADDESPVEVMEARFLLEPGAARMAAERLTEADTEDLSALLAQMEECLHDWERFGELDLQFHIRIAEATHNTVIARSVRALASYASQGLWKSMRESAYLRRSDLPERYLAHHRLTYDALVAGDGEAAARSTLEHLNTSWSISIDGKKLDRKPSRPSTAETES
jgi:GntR family transcriptional repressor for pyruvate dehydrogenase complex